MSRLAALRISTLLAPAGIALLLILGSASGYWRASAQRSCPDDSDVEYESDQSDNETAISTANRAIGGTPLDS